jgi:hypothetical protein
VNSLPMSGFQNWFDSQAQHLGQSPCPEKQTFLKSELFPNNVILSCHQLSYFKCKIIF